MQARKMNCRPPKLRWKILGFAVFTALFIGWMQVRSYGQTLTYPDAASTSQQSGSPAASFSMPGQSSFSGSVPEGKPTPGVLPLSFLGALDRGLRNNLGLLLSSDNTLTARGQKWEELSKLLPHINADVTEAVMQTNLAAQGLRFPGFPTIIGPFGYFDARAHFSEDLSYSAYLRSRGAAENEAAARFSYKDARDLVTLAVGNAYLQALAGAARVETAIAQNQTAQAIYQKSLAQQQAGVSPAIDALRAQVQQQNRQQQLIVSRNSFAKQKLALARIIGLPPGQEFTLTDTAPYEPLADEGLERSLQRAYSSRSDYQAAVQQVRAAERFRNAATAQHYPSITIAGNYGDIGITPGNSHGTFAVAGTLNIPIFQGGRTHGDALQAEARLRQSRQQLENLRGQIDYEVRSALLDVAAAAEQVQVAKSSVDLAGETLVQSQDRFAAGVTDNLEVVQAQEAVSSANESYISSLYAHNLAKVELARALGYAEAGVKQYLKSK
jgi:outer membrane protein TolC